MPDTENLNNAELVLMCNAASRPYQRPYQRDSRIDQGEGQHDVDGRSHPLRGKEFEQCRPKEGIEGDRPIHEDGKEERAQPPPEDRGGQAD